MDSLVECEICTNLRPVYVPIHINDNGSRMEPNPLHESHPMCASCLITRFDVNRTCPICRGRFLRPADTLAAADEENDRQVDEQMPFRNTEDVFGDIQPAINIVEQAREAIRNSRPPRRINRLARGVRAAQRAARQQEEEVVVIPDRHCCWRKERRTDEYPVDGMCLETVIHPSTIDGRDYCMKHLDNGPFEMQLLAQKLENQQLEKSAKEKKRIGEQLLKEQTKRAQLLVMRNASITYFNNLSHGASSVINQQAVQQAAQQTMAVPNRVQPQ